MALLQDRYIKITTGEGGASVRTRNLQALVFTDTAAASGKSYDANGLKKLNGMTAVNDFFGEDAKAESEWAKMYFGYSDPNGNTPSSITFAKINSGESCEAAFKRVVKKTNDFGVFSFLKSMSAADILAVATDNATYNYRFQFVAPITLALINGYSSSDDPIAECVTACVGANGSVGTHLVYQKDTVAVTGSSIVIPKTYILSAILSAIDWDQEDGTVSPMFRTISGCSPDVFNATSTSSSGTYSEVGADDLDDNHVSYYANVQINGSERSFYQKGMNTNAGESALVYMGEVWLKSDISTRILDLMLSVSKIKANVEGNARIYATVDAACTAAVKNGVIERGKTFDETTRMDIVTKAGEATAADAVADNGYWLKTWITKDEDDDNYKAKYLLIYSKNDVVIKVEGSDILY